MSFGERAKRTVPWLVSLAICGVLLWPFRDEAGRAALAQAARQASVWTIPVIALFTVLNWLTDAWATGMTFRYFGTRISIRDACFVRGATLVFDAVNPSVGQLALGVVMYRRGTPLAKTLQTVVLLNIVFTLDLICIAGIGLMLGSYASSGMTSRFVLAGLAVAGAYLALIAVRPRALAHRSSLSNLFEVGLKGHAAAFLVRIPSMVTIFGGVFATLHCFGIAVPTSAVLVYFPAIIFITGLPISVQGIGPAQMAQVAFFASYVNAEPRAAEAVVMAWGLTFSIGTAVGSFLLGLACLFTEVGRAAFVAGRAANVEGALAPAPVAAETKRAA